MKAGTQAQATSDVSASPAVLYDLVSDVRRMGEWSPECRGAEWLRGANGPAVGAKFKGRNSHGVARWSTKSRVVTADPGAEFSFVTGHLGRDMTRWSYRFDATPNGTHVTESFEMLRDVPWYFRLGDRLLMGVKDRKSDLEKNMRETLQRLKGATDKSGRVA
jgi:ribosome-associated toxin RatA of RatAB toxin-antitoxin module